MKKITLVCSLAMCLLGARAQEKEGHFDIQHVQKINNDVYQLVFNPTLNTVYVAGPKEGFDKEAENFIYVLDAENLAIKDSISVGKYLPFGLGLNNKTQTLYVGHSLQNTVSAINLKTKKQTLIRNSKESSKIREIEIDESRNKVYVSDHGKHASVWEIDGLTNTLVRSFDKDKAYLLGLNIDPERGRVYATDGRDMEGNILVFDSDKGTLLRSFKTWSYCPMNIALDKKNNRIFVSQSNDNNVTVLDGNTGDIVKKVYLGYDASPIGIVYDEKHNLIYTANRSKQEVAVIDGGTYTVVERISTDGLPNTISLDPESGTLYVTNKQGGHKTGDLLNANTVIKIVKRK